MISAASKQNVPIAVRRHARARPMELGAVLITGSIMTIPIWVQRGSLAAAVILTATVCLAAATAITSLRATVIASSLLLIPPGVIGENSATRSAIAFALIFALLASSRVEPNTAGREPLITGLLLLLSVLFCIAGVSNGYSLNVALSMGMLYAACGAIVLISAQHVRTIVDSLRAMSLLLGVSVLSYGVSWALGFRLGGDIVAGPNREVTAYFPATITQGVSSSILGLPRLSVFSGEPGLGGVMLLFGLWCAVRLFEGRSRVLLAALIVTGGILTQSTAFLITMMVLGVVAAVLVLRQRAGVTAAVFALIALTVPAVILSSNLLAEKKKSDPLSFSDRGLGQASAIGEINLLSLLSSKPAIGIAFLILCAVTLWATWPRAWDVGLVAAVLLTSLFAQPLHLHPGTWLLLSLTAITAGAALNRSRMAR